MKEMLGGIWSLKMNWRIHITSILTICSLAGCSASEDALSSEAPNNVEQKVDLAQSRLFERDLEGALRLYEERLIDDSTDPSAAAGKAVMDVLLLPYSDSFTALLRDTLGANHALNATRDVIYGDGGYLYLLARGVPFADGESFPGIATLLEDDLPWTTREMTSLPDFVAERAESLDTFWDRLEVVADDLSIIERNLQTAIDATTFKTFFLPGEVLHDQNLNLVMGKSELAALRTVISGVRSLSYFVGAYEFSWSLSDGFGTQWDDVGVAEPGYVEDWRYFDYVARFLSTNLLRVVRNPARLEKAGVSFAEAARGGAQTLRLGQAGANNTVFEWTQADEILVSEVAEFLDAVADSVQGPTTLPFTVPSTTMNLSPLFSAPGRTLSPNLEWSAYVVVEDEFGSFSEWQIPDATLEAFFIDGIMDPAFTLDNPVEVELSGDAVQLGEAVSGDFTSNVEGAYLSGR